MTRKKRKGVIRLYDVVRNLNAIFDTIPSIEERKEILDCIDTLTGFLEELRKRITDLPTDKERSLLLESTSILSDFLEKARTDQTLASIIGLSLKRDISQKLIRKETARIDEQRLASIIKELESLSSEQMYGHLESYTKNQLLDIAEHIGIHANNRLSKADLVDKIVKIGFANIRGYKLLKSPNTRNESQQ